MLFSTLQFKNLLYDPHSDRGGVNYIRKDPSPYMGPEKKALPSTTCKVQNSPLTPHWNFTSFDHGFTFGGKGLWKQAFTRTLSAPDLLLVVTPSLSCNNARVSVASDNTQWDRGALEAECCTNTVNRICALTDFCCSCFVPSLPI